MPEASIPSSASDKRYILRKLSPCENELIYAKWLFKKNGNKRLISVSPYHFVSLKAKGFYLQEVRHKIHLYDLVDVTAKSFDRLTIRFFHKGKRVSIKLETKGVGGELFDTIREAHFSLSHCFLSPLHNFQTTFPAWCEYHKHPPRPGIVRFVEENLDHSFPIDLDNNDHLFFEDLAPLLKSLRLNPQCRELTLLKRPPTLFEKVQGDCLSQIALITSHSPYLTSLEFSNLSPLTLSGWTSLGVSFVASSSFSSLTRLVIRNCPMDFRDSSELSRGLSSLSLEIFMCVSCIAHQKSLSPLLKSLESSPLRELDLSFNTLSVIGTNALTRLLSFQKHLHTLTLQAACIKNFSLLSAAIISEPTNISLRILNLNNNDLNGHSDHLKDILSLCVNIQTLHVQNCNIKYSQ